MSARVTDADGDELWKEAAREDCDTRGSKDLRPLARVGVWKDAVDQTRVEADGARQEETSRTRVWLNPRGRGRSAARPRSSSSLIISPA